MKCFDLVLVLVLVLVLKFSSYAIIFIHDMLLY